MLLWLYCCAPSQTNLQASLLATDKQIARLQVLILEVADQIERLNQKVAPNMFLSVVRKGAVLPHHVLPSGFDLSTIPQQVESIPTVLRFYCHALDLGRTRLKNAVVARPLFRGRLLQVLYFSVKLGNGKRSPYSDMASLILAGQLAAGVTGRNISEANLQKQMKRFRNDHPKDFTRAAAVAALVNDQASKWLGLLLAFLVTKGLTRTS